MPRLTPAVWRSLDILELFLAEDSALSAPEITERTGLPRTTVHELLVTLTARHYLARDEVSGRYRLGLRLFQLGNAYGERIDLVQAATEVARRVSVECNETVHVGVRDGRNVVYIAKVDSTRAVRMVSAVGRTLPAHCTAVGKALLAQMGDEQVADVLSRTELVAHTEHTITDPVGYLRELRRVRTRGYALDEGELELGVRCVAVALQGGPARAALSISGPTTRMTDELVEQVVPHLRNAAAALVAELDQAGGPAPAGPARARTG